MLLFSNYKVLINYLIFVFTTLSTLTNCNILNCNTGTNLLFQYTSMSFNLNLVLLLTLFNYKKCKKSSLIVTIAMLCSVKHTELTLHNYINFGIPNVGLSNILSQYHPPLFFASIVVFVYQLRHTGIKKNKLIAPTNILIVSILLSGWWANQELFWGNYWNWDPVEMSSSLVIIGFITLLHTLINTKGLLSATKQNVHVTISIIMAAYVINRSDLANSVHKFNGTFLLNIDTPLLYIIKITTVATISTLIYKKTKKLTKTMTVPKLFMAYILIIATTYLIYFNITNLFKLSYVGLFQNIVVNLSIYYYIKSKKTPLTANKNTIPSIWPHLLVKTSIYVGIFFQTPPSKALFIINKVGGLIYMRVSDLHLVKYTGTTQNNGYFGGYNTFKNKHQTFIMPTTSSSNLRIFQKPNSDISFLNISPQNYNSLLLVSIL